MGLGILDWILIGFFASHIPITIMFDAQAILPRDLFPAATTNLLSAYAEAFHDPYMGKSPVRPWFASFVACELAFQLPMFFVAIYGLWTQATWLKVPGIIYGTHVCTTVTPILAEVLFATYAPGSGPQTMQERLALVSIYAPYFLLPLAFVVKCINLPHDTDANTKRKTA
eukprot:m.49582 g.49582  ORF g.49582 m.49582 type:complete len:170 (-) comp7132_c0_seq1:293-802(-)